MDGTRRFPPADDASPPHALRPPSRASIAAALPARGRVAVALSGGRDSVALLDATLADGGRRAATRSSRSTSITDCRPNADAWARFCATLCAARGIPCVVASVGRRARRARSASRRQRERARYAALARLAREHAACAPCCSRTTPTTRPKRLLLQLLRGAGSARACRDARRARSTARCGGCGHCSTCRAQPSTTTSCSARLRHVDDESNADARYRATRCAARVVPALRDIAPGLSGHARARGGTAGRRRARSLDDLAALDARDAYDGATLDCAAVRATRRAPRRQRAALVPARAAACRRRRARALRQASRSCSAALPARGSRFATPVRCSACTAAELVVQRRPVEPYSCVWSGAR